MIGAPKISHHPADFGGLKHWGSGDVMVLVCHAIPKDHMVI